MAETDSDRPSDEFGMETLLAEGLQRLESTGEEGLEALCAAHPAHADELLRRVARLRDRGLLARPPISKVGSFFVLRTLGRGGMGEVFLAEQREPVRRLVALKIVRDDRGGPEALARFVAERQALALMDHPAIAHVYEAGATDEGRPYLAMEYVDGVALSTWCDQRRLPVRERLALLAEVCDAVHHAHQNGVIHRDLKPSNVLVKETGGRARPKVIDFGLAKAFDSTRMTSALDTELGRPIGTPAYMSPEQARGDGRGVDVRTDVYALGVMLYELGSGLRPFADDRLECAGLPEMLRILREEEPPSPSRRFAAAAPADAAAIAERRGATVGALARDLRGELDWIVARAIAKSAGDRYASVSELAADLRRHLAGEAVLAGPPSAGYRFLKFARRHRAPLAIGGAVLLAAVIALAVIVRLGLEASENLRRFDRLAMRGTVRELLREAEEELWPVHPRRVADLEAWLARAAATGGRARCAEIASEIEGLAGRGAALSAHETVLLEGLRMLHADLTRLVGEGGTYAEVAQRLDRARDIEARTVTQHAAAWAHAIAGIKARHGIELRPIIGLVPLGQDPASGSFEFAVATANGRLPERGPDGVLRIAHDDDDPVLVLIEGGELAIGSQADRPDAPHHDAARGQDETRFTRLALDPYLIAKFEITQAQWQRVMGSTPSVFASDQQAGRAVGVASRRHPVESVSWLECAAFCRRLGLEIPSEAQWEHAARAGTDTPWWTGRERSSLRGAANLSDKARAEGFRVAGRVEPDFDDGHAVHAPVGSFRANSFGLHDVLGNVWEWCRVTEWTDGPDDPDAVQPWRGGSFMSDAPNARITYRVAEAARNRKHLLGLRPVLTLSHE
ncbi:MAG: SUMF1/EgtB/PvdO family nonheme iron enzyme [Planctomycetes bacterium]|nr:SUMF1/EgtB/PvdO family nonheme iron enzyme [Planctomycetota bacterium]